MHSLTKLKGADQGGGTPSTITGLQLINVLGHVTMLLLDSSARLSCPISHPYLQR
jgi:hypothetical protein